jgi:hypothetical protein
MSGVVKRAASETNLHSSQSADDHVEYYTDKEGKQKVRATDPDLMYSCTLGKEINDSPH